MLKVSGPWSHGDMVTDQDAILHQLRQGSMPCDGTWLRDQVALFSRWISAGSPP
jgi:hypothetical protein